MRRTMYLLVFALVIVLASLQPILAQTEEDSEEVALTEESVCGVYIPQDPDDPESMGRFLKFRSDHICQAGVTVSWAALTDPLGLDLDAPEGAVFPSSFEEISIHVRQDGDILALSGFAPSIIEMVRDTEDLVQGGNGLSKRYLDEEGKGFVIGLEDDGTGIMGFEFPWRLSGNSVLLSVPDGSTERFTIEEDGTIVTGEFMENIVFAKES